MRVRPEQLASQLQKSLAPVYLISGDEALLVQEACDAVRARAREAGCHEREVLQVDNRFNWDHLLASSAEMSLFADSKLIELQIPSGKPGMEGSKALVEYLEQGPTENILLIVAGKIDKQSTNSKWFKALDKAGIVVQVWPVDARELPRWMQQRLSQAGLQIEPEALQLLCDRVEGNLLAAVQEIEKLKLLNSSGTISAADVGDSVADNARYNLFALIDSALLGDATGAMKMLHGLRAEGVEPAVILWGLSREIRLLYQCQTEIGRGQAQQRVLQSQRVWDKRKPIVGAGLARHSLVDLAELLHRANLADQSIKGLADGDPWQHLSQLTLDLARGIASLSRAG
jgi:DNA polymerase-3 subunit delta